MDDALVQAVQLAKSGLQNVLILVVMDDALVLVKAAALANVGKSLNPCCNG